MLEFRVRWQREGCHPTTRIFQSWNAAYTKASGLLALDDVKTEFAQYEGMRDLVGPPVIEVREVGPWKKYNHQFATATDYGRQRMRDYARLHVPASPQEDAGASF